MHVTVDTFESAIAALPVPPPDPKVVQTLKLLYKILEGDDDWSGGCFMVTAIAHILLSEQGVASLPCCGEVAGEAGPFDHAWLEIDGAIFDLPIQYPHDRHLRLPAVIGGHHLGGTATRLVYGADPKSYGKVALGPSPGAMIQHLSLGAYIDGAEEHGLDLWFIVLTLGKKLGLQLDRSVLRSKYAATRWTIKDKVAIPKDLMRGWRRIQLH